jgi:crotonobetainyl-CoA:carnitine CoA-transferase CaiB-like acyl-CoA transferase
VSASLPLDGVVVADYSQYVAGPFCTLLLADLGADVVKVEPPHGDPWRRQEPCGDDLSKPFVALNRNKRSVVLDLKSDEGRRASAELIARAEVVIHNSPSQRAEAFGLDASSVLAVQPSAVIVKISAFGSDGPGGDRIGYDLSAQSASGLLMADARVGDEVPIRAGGIAMTDFSAGMLATVAALAGVLRARATGRGGEIELSLLGAGLALQTQRFVSVDSEDHAHRDGSPATARAATRAELDAVANEAAAKLSQNPYYRAYGTADGFITVACLNLAQRTSLLSEFGLEDQAASNPDEPPQTSEEVRRRERLGEAVAAGLAERPALEWVKRLRARGVPCEQVRTLDSLFEDAQIEANGLVQRIWQPGLETISLLGSLFKIDGETPRARQSAPARGEHTHEVLSSLPSLTLEPDATP